MDAARVIGDLTRAIDDITVIRNALMRERDRWTDDFGRPDPDSEATGAYMTMVAGIVRDCYKSRVDLLKELG